VNWFWLNIPLAAVFFLVVTGASLWLVFKHPDARPALADRPGKSRRGMLGAQSAATGLDGAGLPQAGRAVVADRDDLEVRELVGSRR